MMEFQPKTYKLKTNNSIRIRVPKFDEVQKLVNLKKAI